MSEWRDRDSYPWKLAIGSLPLGLDTHFKDTKGLAFSCTARSLHLINSLKSMSLVKSRHQHRFMHKGKADCLIRQEGQPRIGNASWITHCQQDWLILVGELIVVHEVKWHKVAQGLGVLQSLVPSAARVHVLKQMRPSADSTSAGH